MLASAGQNRKGILGAQGGGGGDTLRRHHWPELKEGREGTWVYLGGFSQLNNSKALRCRLTALSPLGHDLRSATPGTHLSAVLCLQRCLLRKVPFPTEEKTDMCKVWHHSDTKELGDAWLREKEFSSYSKYWETHTREKRLSHDWTADLAPWVQRGEGNKTSAWWVV